MAPSLKERLRSGGLWVILGKVATASCNIVAVFILTHLLTTALFGVYGLAMSVVMFGATVAQLGVHLAVVRLVAEAMATGRPGHARGAVRLAYVYVALGNAIVVVVLFLGGGRLIAERWSMPELRLVLVGVVVWLVLQSFQVLTSEVFRGFQDLKLATLFGGVISWGLTVVGLGVLWVGWGEVAFGSVIAVLAGSTGASVVAGLFLLRRRLVGLGPAQPSRPGEIFGIALPLWISGLFAMTMGQIDLWTLGSYVPKEQVGVYFLAVRLETLVAMSLLLVNLVVAPFIAELYAKRERERLQRVLRNTATIAGIPGLLAVAVLVLFGRPILGAFGEDYSAGAVVLALLCMRSLANVLTGSCAMVMSMTGHQWVQMTITIVSSVLTMIAVLWGVRAFGMVGAAAGAMSGSILLNLAMWLAARYLTGLWTHVGWVRWGEVRLLFK